MPAEQVAFVLSGGSTRGAVQVGMLRALTEWSVVPDFVIGTSVGALNAAVFSAAPDVGGLSRLAELWESAPRAQIFPFSPLSLLKRAAMRNGYLLPNDGLRTWIDSQTEFELLEDFPIPLHVVTTDVESGEAVILSEGDAVMAMLASSAIPGVFPPIPIGGRLLCDGAIAANTPITEAVTLGATTVYVLPTAPDPLIEEGASRSDNVPTFRRPTASARVKGFQLLDLLFGRRAPEAPPPALNEVTIHRLPAGPVADTNPFSFRASRRLIEQSYALTRRWLEAQQADEHR